MKAFVTGGGAVVVLAAGIVACGGGSGPSNPNPRTSLSPQLVAVPVVVTQPLPLPAALTGLSIGAAIAQSSSPPATTIALAPGASNCSATAATLTCHGTVQAPIGPDAFTLETLGPGNAALASGSLTFTVTNPPAGSLAISPATLAALNGVIARLQLAVAPATLTVGTPGTASLSVTAFDASGATIAGSQSYNTPVTVSIAAATASLPPIFSNVQATGAIGSIAAPGHTLTLTYNGQAAPSVVSFVANSVGVTSPAAPLAFVGTPSPTPFVIPSITPPPPGVQPATPTPGPVALSPNFVAFVGPEAPPVTFTACEAQPPALTTCLPGPANFTATASNPSLLAVSPSATANPATGLATFTLAPGTTPGGPILVTVTDAQGRTGSLFAYINQASVILQKRGRSR